MRLRSNQLKAGRVSPLRAVSSFYIRSAHGVTRPTKSSAFTMVEIALALAIIGFALVAIIGVLPAGLNVQRDNREETVIVHDANYLVDAIRNGQRGLDDLTNYVEGITNYVQAYDVDGNKVGPMVTNGYTYADYTIDNVLQSGASLQLHRLTNGYRIIGLLSTPKYLYPQPGGFKPYRPANDPVRTPFISNYVVAYIRSLSGAAVEKPPQGNLDVRDISFRYRLISEFVPYSNWSTNDVDYQLSGLTVEEIITRSNRWRLERINQANSGELRLNFRWPVNGRREAGPQAQAFRTLTAGPVQLDPGTPDDKSAGRFFWIVKPSEYLKP